jgi:sensor histidine kinase YesM
LTDITTDRPSYHPLEIIPFFRRFPASFARDMAYTFIWSGFFALGFYLITAMATGHFLPLRGFGLIFLVSNIIGYSIHFLYHLGSASGLEAGARRAGGLARTAYYSLVPIVGVMVGFLMASFIVDPSLRTWLADAETLLTMLTISLAVSLVLSVIFFWRERDARNAASLATERERAERTERQATLANLRALQAQIEPHFLFNTLANVVGLIDPDPATAKRMLETFIRFLRASLGATRRESTTLAEEGELIGAYLAVLQIRMGERLRYRIAVAPELAGFAIPPMLLQPLVENAIRHGLEPEVEGGEVTFTARREGTSVAVEIADSGVGFAPTTRGGLGLANLRERLRLLYGERGSLSIEENAPRGTRVTVRIPDAT